MAAWAQEAARFRWALLPEFMAAGVSFDLEARRLRQERRNMRPWGPGAGPAIGKRRRPEERLRAREPW